jgi:hypothetical protein
MASSTAQLNWPSSPANFGRLIPSGFGRPIVAVTIEKELIPGAIKGADIESTLFPDSARRPYKDRSKIKATSEASKIRTHIMKASLNREHITKEMCRLNQMEFNGFIHELVAADLIRLRIEDGITYYDATIKSEVYEGKTFGELRKFTLDALEAVAKGTAEGTIDALRNIAAASAR